MAQRILQLTDLHVFSEPGTRLKGIPTRESLTDVVSHIQAHERHFDHVIVTGDHTHDELEASYEAVRTILSPFSDRLYQVPGNHDDRDVLRRVFLSQKNAADSTRIEFHFETESWLIIGLDTHWPGEVAGMMDVDRIDWLQSVLSSGSAEHIALFCHHPPVDVNSIWMDDIGLHGRELLHSVVAGDKRIRFICCGHVHHEFSGRLHQADVLTTPSTGIQFDPAGDVPNFASAAPGYRVIELDGDEYRTHVVRLPQVKYVPADD